MRAFSLLELMVVVGLIGIIGALAAPNVSGAIRRANEPQVAARVSALVAEARNTARRGNRCVRLVLDSDKTLHYETFHTCTPPAVCACPESTQAERSRALTLSGADGTLSLTSGTNLMSELAAVEGADRVLFLPSGATPYADRAVMRYVMPSGRTRSVSVLPAAGIVRVEG